MDQCGDSPYNPINGENSTSKVSLIKAGRGIGAGPYSPMTSAYMPNSSQSVGHGKGSLHEMGAGRPLRANADILDMGTHGVESKRTYMHQETGKVIPDQQALAAMMKGSKPRGMSDFVKQSQDNVMQPGGPAIIKPNYSS